MNKVIFATVLTILVVQVAQGGPFNLRPLSTAYKPHKDFEVMAEFVEYHLTKKRGTLINGNLNGALENVFTADAGNNKITQTSIDEKVTLDRTNIAGVHKNPRDYLQVTFLFNIHKVTGTVNQATFTIPAFKEPLKFNINLRRKNEKINNAVSHNTYKVLDITLDGKPSIDLADINCDACDGATKEFVAKMAAEKLPEDLKKRIEEEINKLTS